jgi:Leucine-rich repeat (LRR) protein
MKKLYFLFFLTLGFIANAQIVNIPDANFKARLLAASTTNTIAENLSGNYFKIDANSDNEIQESEALQVSVLRIGASSIISLEGIQSFANLQFLFCTYNQIVSLDLAGMINLRGLHCSYNQINSITFNNLINLRTLNCDNNQLNALNLVGLNNLQTLNCFSNSIQTIQLNGLTNMVSVDCQSNQLTHLDVSDLINLQNLYCTNNQLESLFIKNSKIETNLSFSINPNIRYICADENQLISVQNLINSYGYSSCHVNTYCSFVPGGVFYEITGNTKFDSDNNGCDVSDINYSNLRFNITNGTISSSMIANQTGNYYIPVQAGIHTITPHLENPSFFNFLPSSFTVNFPTQASPFIQDFCVTANGVHHDVEVIIVATSPARPGFDAKYKLIYRNKGNQIENGSVSLSILNQDAFDIVLINPVFNSESNDGYERTIQWNYTNLLPFESREIEIVLNLNSPIETPALNDGDLLNMNAIITPFINDEYINDNEMPLRQIIVNSFDPNDKTCLEGTIITPSEVGNYVHYIIRFENTGTYPAQNIVVKDMIDLTKFDITTLVPLKSSHDFFTRINGNKVEFIFENINLDFNDATNDGYVVFKIKTLPTLVLGDTFTNDANIYFDYNFPITTNTYTTTVAALSTQDFDFGTYFTLYPNPAKDVLNMQAKQDVTINSIEIYNQLGQILMATTNAINSVDVSNLASGTYFVKVNTEKGSANAKFVKE